MAINHYYIDAANGNDTTGDGSIGTPWATIQKAWNTATEGTNGTQVNLRDNATHQLSANLALTTFVATNGAPTATQPLITRGYTTTANDGGRATIDFNGYNAYNNTSGADILYWYDLILTKSGAAQTSSFMSGGNGAAWIWRNCTIYHTATIGAGVVRAGSGSQVLACHFYDNTGINALLTHSGWVGNYRIIDNTFDSIQIAASKLLVLDGHNAVVQNNLFIIRPTSGASSFPLSIVQSSTAYVVNNTFCTQVASTVAQLNLGGVILNNLVVGASGTGGIGITGSGIRAGNAVYNCTTAYSGTPDWEPQANITLSADPFVDAANGDFRLKTDSAAIEAGYPQSYPNYGSVTNKPDIGAYQRGAGAAGVVRRVARILGR